MLDPKTVRSQRRVFDRYFNRTDLPPITQPHPGTASQASERVALLLNGLETDSADDTMDGIGAILARHYDTEFFSYRAIGAAYDYRDTHKPIPNHVALLEQYLRHFSHASRIALVGYSLGGLILMHWLTREGREHLSKIDRVVLIASPVWSPQALLPVEALPSSLHTVLEDYDFEWEAFRKEVLPVIEFLVLRCEIGHDRIILPDDLLISWDKEGFNVDELGVPDVDHRTICPAAAPIIGRWITDAEGD